MRIRNAMRFPFEGQGPKLKLLLPFILFTFLLFTGKVPAYAMGNSPESPPESPPARETVQTPNPDQESAASASEDISKTEAKAAAGAAPAAPAAAVPQTSAQKTDSAPELAAPLPKSNPADSIVEGVDYRATLSPLKYDKNASEPYELVNLFWYGCGTCRQIDQNVDEFARILSPDVNFVKIHTMYAPNPAWMVHAHLYHTMDYLGKEKELRKEIFAEVQERGGYSPDGHPLAGLTDLESSANFAAKHGIPKEEFIAAWNSPEVKARMDHALTFINNLNLDSVPAMAVNGKWTFNIVRGKGLGHFFQTAARLLAMEKEASPQAGVPSALKSAADLNLAEEAKEKSELPSPEILRHETDDSLAQKTIDPVNQDPEGNP
jgi:thiol:disulfide interchange protein DsbA